MSESIATMLRRVKNQHRPKIQVPLVRCIAFWDRKRSQLTCRFYQADNKTYERNSS